MESLFINAGLAAGAALASIPIILHLFFRQKPKLLVFPALRLVKERQKQSRKKLRIKNWLLLLARVALIVLMALALARPRLWSKTSLGDGEVPTAMAMVFDTSLSMSYTERDKTRLEEAKERARTILKRAHAGSRVFVIDSAQPITPAPLSPVAAQKRLDGLTILAINRPLNAALQAASKALEDTDQPRREIYVFTDLARSGWDLGQPLRTEAKAEDTKKEADKKPTVPQVATYLVRLSPEKPRNVAVVEARPVSAFAAAGEPALVRAVLRNTGAATTRTAQFYIDDVKRAQQTVELGENGETTVEFLSPKLGAGLHQGEIRLGGEPDPLEADDRRFFTLEVEPPLRVLVVADQAIDGDFVVEALDPAVLRTSGNRPFPVERIASSQLGGSLNAPLESYSAIFLLNVARLPESAWGRLNSYLRNGGGLVIGLGDRVETAAWNQQASALLPGELREVDDRSQEFFTFGEADIAHPLFAANTKELLAELSRVPVYRYVKFKPNPSARTLLSYQNGEPALLERTFPSTRPGHLLFWTTALSRRPGNTPAERAATWTDFPMPTVGWSFFYLTNQMVPYLAGKVGKRLTYEAGEDVALPIDGKRARDRYTIQGPETQPARIGQPVTGAGLLIPAPPLVGQWKVTAFNDDKEGETLGFSVNPPKSESQLGVLAEPELVTLFGDKEQFALVDDPEKIENVIDSVRIGRELFPLIMFIILLVVTLESLLANTFYRDRPSSGANVFSVLRRGGS